MLFFLCFVLFCQVTKKRNFVFDFHWTIKVLRDDVALHVTRAHLDVVWKWNFLNDVMPNINVILIQIFSVFSFSVVVSLCVLWIEDESGKRKIQENTFCFYRFSAYRCRRALIKINGIDATVICIRLFDIGKYHIQIKWWNRYFRAFTNRHNVFFTRTKLLRNINTIEIGNKTIEAPNHPEGARECCTIRKDPI